MNNEIKDFEVKMVFRGDKFELPELDIQTYREEFFSNALDLESELFYEFRKKYGFTPHRINESSAEEMENIKRYFLQNRESFYFLFAEGEYAGHLLMCGNSLESLCIGKKYQRHGYGSFLTKHAANKALDNGYKEIFLIVFCDNFPAIDMYKRLGFLIEE